MNARKSDLRGIVLAIIFRKEKVAYPPDQFNSLSLGVAEVLARRAGGTRPGFSYHPEPHLDNADKMLVQEIFWDLIVERVITIGLNADNLELPFFRLHSDADANLKRGSS